MRHSELLDWLERQLGLQWLQHAHMIAWMGAVTILVVKRTIPSCASKVEGVSLGGLSAD